jgi:hypothetical protein
MNDSQSEIEGLKEQVTRLESQVDLLHRELDRAVQLIDRYGETLGHHLKGVLADQGALSQRVAHLERALSESA